MKLSSTRSIAPKPDLAVLLSASLLGAGILGLSTAPVYAAADGWSVVPYIGFSQLGDQSPTISADEVAPGRADVSVDSGFAAGLSFRYDYSDSAWSSEIGWEYRSNDSVITDVDGTRLPDGNYASNTFYLNGRYALMETAKLTPWVGGGISVIQELDLDSEDSDGELSFSDSGALGFQLMAGIDYDLTDRIYLTSELRYTNFSDLKLGQEGGSGRVSNIEYQPITLGVGIGFRF